MSDQAQRLEKASTSPGFIAALDQSGGSTPKALRLYGVDESSYQNEAEMFDMVHAMRSRIMTNSSFNGDRILGAILFENTMDRQVEGKPTSQYLWQEKGVLPFLKIDKGLAEEQDSAQIMKPMPELDALLAKANEHEIFGTKMRSVIKMANPAGIEKVVNQQFDIARQIIAAGMVPIIEPEVDIHSVQKAEAESILRDQLIHQLDSLDSDQLVMLKLTLPEENDFYQPCVNHSNVVRVVALSGGYNRTLANQKLAENHGMIASFSRALTEGLSANQSDTEFTQTLDQTIESICRASAT